MNRPTTRRVLDRPLRLLGELAWDVIAALHVPDRYGRWNLHRWETR